MTGNVTREGIDADLTAMRDIGLGGALMFDGSNDVPKGPVNYISPHWLDLMTHRRPRRRISGSRSGCITRRAGRRAVGRGLRRRRDRKSGGKGKGGSVRVELGGARDSQKK